MKVDSLDSIKLINNAVLVKPDPANDKMILESGVVLFLNTSYAKEQHAVTSGTVIAVPDKLVYTKQRSSNSLEYITKQELFPGDKIIYHYQQTMINIKDEKYIEYNGEAYFLIQYDSVFCALRNTAFEKEPVVIPVNGLVIVEPEGQTEAELPTSRRIIIPEYLKKRKSEMRGRIRYIGTPLDGYCDFPEYGGDRDEYKVGDSILFNTIDSIPLQYEMHRLFDKDKSLYRMRRRDILAKVEEPVTA